MLHREERLNKIIREKLSELIAKELELPALTTITSVEVDDGLRRANAKFSSIPIGKAEEVLRILDKESGFLRSKLDKKIKIRSIPEIIFEIDYGPEKAAIIEKELLK
jgi:ribosome-binding factor A